MKNRIIILASGYSVKSEGLDLYNLWDKIKEEDIWSLNFSYRFMPYLPTKQIWADTSVWEKCKDSLLMLAQYGTELHARNYGGYEEYPQVKLHRVENEKHELMPFTDDKGLEWDSIFIGRCGFVGLFALSLACAMKYDEIYLLGYDFGTVDQTVTNTHWYEEQDKGINAGAYGRTSIYLQGDEPRPEIEDFKEYLKSKSKIYNVSTISRIDYFEKLTYEEFFNKIK